ncbi:MAG: nucleoside deaminase [Alphaproteobacteria bacterium]|nr:nucleoside deaminase [Alphaproteobacteria bacterium]
MTDKYFMICAIEKAKESVAVGGFPAGAVVVMDGKVVGEGISVGNKLHDPTSHGEMAAIRDACKNLESSDLSRATLYASMQPCLMCFAASAWASIGRIVYACPKEAVSLAYYGGSYDTARINVTLLLPIELVHFPELEVQSMDVVRAWETRLSLS